MIDPLKEESARAFAAFATYYAMGSKRSIEKAMNLFCEEEDIPRTGGQLSWWKKWSVRFTWQERCKRADSEALRERLSEAEETKREILADICTSAKGLGEVLLAIAKGETKGTRLQLDAIKYALGLIGLSPSQPIELIVASAPVDEEPMTEADAVAAYEEMASLWN